MPDMDMDDRGTCAHRIEAGIRNLFRRYRQIGCLGRAGYIAGHGTTDNRRIGQSFRFLLGRSGPTSPCLQPWLASNAANLNRYHQPFRGKKHTLEERRFAARNAASIGFVLPEGIGRNG